MNVLAIFFYDKVNESSINCDDGGLPGPNEVPETPAGFLVVPDDLGIRM